MSSYFSGQFSHRMMQGSDPVLCSSRLSRPQLGTRHLHVAQSPVRAHLWNGTFNPSHVVRADLRQNAGIFNKGDGEGLGTGTGGVLLIAAMPLYVLLNQVWNFKSFKVWTLKHLLSTGIEWLMAESQKFFQLFFLVEISVSHLTFPSQRKGQFQVKYILEVDNKHPENRFCQCIQNENTLI